MARAQEIIESVRWAVQGVVKDHDAVAAIAERCAAAVRQVQSACERASRLARAGAHHEAVAILNSNPMLLEDAESFAQPALDEWIEFCTENLLPAPPLVDMEMIQELRQAVLRVGAIQPLLVKFRLQNLALESALSRLRTLRRIVACERAAPAAADPDLGPATKLPCATESARQSDLIAFERAALKELLKDFDVAVGTGNLEQAQRIRADAAQGGWVIGEAALAAEKMLRMLADLLARDAADRARQLAELIHADYMAESLDSASEKLGEWRSLQPLIQGTSAQLPESVRESVTAVEHWLAERFADQERRTLERARLAALQALCEAAHGRLEALQAAFRSVEGDREGCPEPLRTMVEQRLQSMRAHQRARRRMVVSCTVLGVLVLLGVTAFAVQSTVQHFQANEIAAQARARLESGDVDGAAAMLEKARASGPATDAIVAAEAEIEAALERDHQRAAKVLELLALAGAPTAESADRTPIDQAELLARTTEEREALAQWRNTFAAAEAARRDARHGAFTQAIARATEALLAVATLDPVEHGTSARLTDLEEQISEMARREDVSSALRVSAEALVARARLLREGVELARTTAERARRAKSMLADLSTSIRTPHRHAEALRTYARINPEAEEVSAFERAADLLVCWEAVAAWDELTAASRGAVATGSSTVNQQRQDLLGAYLVAHPASPLAAAAQRASAALSARAISSNAVKDMVEQWPPMRYRATRLRDGRTLYHPAGSSLSEAEVDGRHVLIVPAFTSTNTPKTSFQSIPTAEVIESSPSAQSKLADELIAMLRIPAGELGVPSILTAIHKVCDAQAVDPAIRAYLALTLLEQLLVEAPALRAHIEPALVELREAQIDQIDWVKQSNPAQRRETAALERILAGVEVEKAFRTLCAAGEKLVADILQSTLIPAGVLMVTANEPTLLNDVCEARPGDELVAVEESNSQPCLLVRVGTVGADGAVNWNTAAFRQPSGTILFASPHAAAEIFSPVKQPSP